MGTNKERIENLEAGLGGLQNSFNRMETGVTNKLYHIETVISKLLEILMAKQTTSDNNASNPTSSSPNDRYHSIREETRENLGGRPLFSSKLANLEFP